MAGPDVVVVGAGISGLSFAYGCAKAGRTALVLERDAVTGGCIRTQRLADGFWWELGAHTCYNSYGALLEALEERGALSKLQPRAKAPFRLYADGEIRSIFRELSVWELLRHAPRLFTTKKDGRSVRGYYSSFTGPNNYDRVFGPLFAAVPSQRADDFPAEMLFKKRTRRKDVLRSFTMKNGLQTATDELAATPGVQVRTGAEVASVERRGGGFAVTLKGGETLDAPRLAVAVPPPTAASLLQGAFPQVAAALGRIAAKEILTVGVSVRAADTPLEPVAGIVPVNDVFFSAVSRDVVPDPERRGFSFHFRPGTPPAQAQERIAQVLRCAPEKLEHVVSRTVVLPSPVVGHAAVAQEIAAAVQDTPLFVVGNYFAGLSIEDCVQRARAEAKRLVAAGA